MQKKTLGFVIDAEFGYNCCFNCLHFSVNKKYENGIVILGYHGVVSDEEKNTLKADDKYTLSVSQFRTHMQYLYENGYKTLSMQELLDYCDGKRN